MCLCQGIRPRLGKLINYKVRNRDLTDDLLQDVFVKTYPKAERLVDPGATTYLLRTTESVIRDHFRGKYGRSYDRTFVELPEIATYETPHQDYVAQEREDFYVREVAPALGTLSEQQRAAIKWYLAPRRQKESPISKSTLRSRKDTAIRSLRKKLGLAWRR